MPRSSIDAPMALLSPLLLPCFTVMMHTEESDDLMPRSLQEQRCYRVRPTILVIIATILCSPLLLDAQDTPRPDYPGVTYAVTDDTIRLRLDIFEPLAGTPKPWPVVVYIHGGGWKSGSRALGRRGAILLERGYAVISIDYRLSHQAIFPAQIHDCKGAIRWIRGHADEYGFDTDRIGVFGNSAGGHLAALLGTSGDVAGLEGEVGGNAEFSSRVQAVCSWAGLGDMIEVPTFPGFENHAKAGSPIGLLLGGPIAEKEELARSASPTTYISNDDPPFLLQHGTEDGTVPFAGTVNFVALLRAAGLDVEFRPSVGAGHGLHDHDSTFAPVTSFFDRVFFAASSVEEINLPSRTLDLAGVAASSRKLRIPPAQRINKHLQIVRQRCAELHELARAWVLEAEGAGV